jgi:hypothetical protein
MSHDVTIKFAPIFTAERFSDPAWTRPGRTMCYPGALKFLPGTTTVPLLVDHDDGREIGTVNRLFQMDWVDGPWICASATIDGDPPCWLERGNGASFGSRVLDRREVSVRDTTAEVIAYALMDEVSVLITKKPGEPRAAVLSVERIEDAYRPPFWDELEVLVGYRITDENFERAILEANRPQIEKHYDEFLAARPTEPQVLVRSGMGQVLGVR